MTGDSKMVVKNLVRLFFTEKIDDVYSDLTDDQKEFCDKLKEKYRETATEVLRIDQSLNAEMTRKEYALTVSSSEIGKMFMGYFMQKYTSPTSFSEWLKSVPKNRSDAQFESYMEFWRNGY
jgi:hypothetical protein